MPTPKINERSPPWLKFDFTINLPLILTLFIGFGSVVMTVVKGYFDHEVRLVELELKDQRREKEEQKFDASALQSTIKVMANDMSHFAEENRKQTEEINKISAKVDTLFQRKGGVE